MWVVKEFGLNRFVSEQPAYNLLDRRLECEFIPMAQTYGIAIMPCSPTAGGFLTGKYRRGVLEVQLTAEDHTRLNAVAPPGG